MKSDVVLDLRGVLCPINFVRVKLVLEEMETDQVLEVILDCGDPIQNVPKSVKEEGHKVLEVAQEEGGACYRVFIQKNGNRKKE